jgi:hypothetical protein
MEENLGFNMNAGGNDVFANNGTQLLITDLQMGEQFLASVIDFLVDDLGKGYVYFDGQLFIEQDGIFDYDSLEQMFYSMFSIEQI